MNNNLNRLAERRNYLIAQSSAQRLALAQNIEPWRQPLARVDQGLAALRYIRSHPVWLLGGSILITALQPGRIGKYFRRGWVAWQMRRHFLDR